MKKFYQKYKYYIGLFLIITLFFLLGVIAGASAKAKTISNNEPAEIEAESIQVDVPDKRTSLGEFKLTAYCTCSECCGDYSDGYTSTMTVATPGRTVAVDPSVIPYGTEIYIDGYEEPFVAEDCGGAIRGNHIDVLCASHELAEIFGVQFAEVFIDNSQVLK